MDNGINHDQAVVAQLPESLHRLADRINSDAAVNDANVQTISLAEIQQARLEQLPDGSARYDSKKLDWLEQEIKKNVVSVPNARQAGALPQRQTLTPEGAWLSATRLDDPAGDISRIQWRSMVPEQRSNFVREYAANPKQTSVESQMRFLGQVLLPEIGLEDRNELTFHFGALPIAMAVRQVKFLGDRALPAESWSRVFEFARKQVGPSGDNSYALVSLAEVSSHLSLTKLPVEDRATLIENLMTLKTPVEEEAAIMRLLGFTVETESRDVQGLDLAVFHLVLAELHERKAIDNLASEIESNEEGRYNPDYNPNRKVSRDNLRILTPQGKQYPDALKNAVESYMARYEDPKPSSKLRAALLKHFIQ